MTAEVACSGSACRALDLAILETVFQDTRGAGWLMDADLADQRQHLIRARHVVDRVHRDHHVVRRLVRQAAARLAGVQPRHVDVPQALLFLPTAVTRST